VFPRILAAVSDVGGMMAHTAIISREYGLPAVVGTGFATTTIRTGDLIEVDGSAGTVRILEEAPR
jgi:pyruvate,water dikinase